MKDQEIYELGIDYIKSLEKLADANREVEGADLRLRNAKRERDTLKDTSDNNAQKLKSLVRVKGEEKYIKARDWVIRISYDSSYPRIDVHEVIEGKDVSEDSEPDDERHLDL